MFIFQHALANLRRNSGRNLLLGIVIFLIITLAAISNIIHSTSSVMIAHYKDQFGSEIMIQNTDTANAEKLSVEQLLLFSSSEYIQNKEFLAKAGYVPKNLSSLDDDGDTKSLKGYLIGSSRSDISDEFQKGTRKLIEGNQYAHENECIISKKFADLNSLKVGDMITLQNNGQAMDTTLQISGIYEDVSLQADSNTYKIALTNRSNEIYTSYDTLMKTEIFQSYGSLDIKLYLKDPSMLENFKQEVTAKGLSDAYEITTNQEEYERIIAPVEHLASISQAMMLGVLTLGSALLILISIMAMKERTYEIGVLRAIGMKKKQVVMGLLSEILMITGICLVIGLGTAQIVAQPIANTLISSQLPFEDNEDTSTNKLCDEKASLTFDSILEISFIAFGLAAIASAGGILFTIRYEPIKILNKQK